MFCPKCGKQLPDGQAFCSYCGAPTGVSAPAASAAPAAPVSAPAAPNAAAQAPAANAAMPPRVTVGTLHCPHCKSTNLQTLVENNQSVDVTTTGSGYSGSKACLGTLLFGPFGLLCGSCGQSQKTHTSVTTTTKTFWVCQNCGAKFRHLQEWAAELDAQYQELEKLRNSRFARTTKDGLILDGGSVITAAICAGISTFIFALNNIFTGIIVGLIVGAVVMYLGALGFKKRMEAYMEENRAYEELKANSMG